MAGDGTVQVAGARELRRSLKRAGDDLGDLKLAHRAAAEVVAGTGRSGAPRRSGQLAGSVRGSGTKTAAVVRAGRASVPYAMPIHWGWARRNITANPWLSVAATSTEDRWQQLYLDAVEDIIRKVEGA